MLGLKSLEGPREVSPTEKVNFVLNIYLGQGRNFVGM